MLHTKPPTIPWLNRTQLLIGIVALLLGALVYLTLRSPDKVYFTNLFGIHEPLFDIQAPILKGIGARIPAFLHVFAFIMITAAFFSFNKKAYITICSGWFLVDACFELGQKYKDLANRLTFDFFNEVPFLEATGNYFRRGTFDVFDLLAYAVGAITAYFVLSATKMQLK